MQVDFYPMAWYKSNGSSQNVTCCKHVEVEFTMTLRNKTRGTSAKIVVIHEFSTTHQQETLQELGMLQVCEDGSFRNQNSTWIQDLGFVMRCKDTSENSAVASS